MTKKGLLIACMVLILTGCSEYQQLLKSTDPELKYEKALVYFNDEQYVKAQTLLDDITTYYRGTDRSQDVLAFSNHCVVLLD